MTHVAVANVIARAPDPPWFRVGVAIFFLAFAVRGRRWIRKNVRICPQCGIAHALRGPKDAICAKCRWQSDPAPLWETRPE
jgi:predicted  nucleic acid-binding Zn ribbon protein